MDIMVIITLCYIMGFITTLVIIGWGFVPETNLPGQIILQDHHLCFPWQQSLIPYDDGMKKGHILLGQLIP